MAKAKLETVDLEAVEILAAGGPVFGIGSPPEGDFWTAEDLRAMAEADAELGDEIKPPVKIGHSHSQQLAQNSGLVEPSPGEMPAVGWMENLRVSEDGSKLLADLMAVPKKLAEVIEAGGYRTRSVELSKVTSQVSGKVYDWVVTGLAWLGGKLPAVRTLDDVVALYEGDGVEIRRQVSYAAGDVVWTATEGLAALRARVSEALNGESSDGMCDPRFYVRDIAPGKALVEDWMDTPGMDRAWVVPFTITADGTASVASRDEWTTAEQQWVEAAKQYEQRVTGAFRVRSDTGRQMPDVTLTEDALRELADALKIEGDVTPEALVEAAKTATAEPAAGGGGEDATRDLEEQKEFEKRLEAAEKKASETAEELRLERRRHFIEELVKDGKIKPGDRDTWETRYDKDPELVREFAADLQPDENLKREYGSDQDGTNVDPEEKRKLEDEQYKADAARRGIEVTV